MAKQFFDVFPTLKLDKKMQELFEQVSVEKVSATKDRGFIRVTIVCDYLIPKETVYQVEAEIKKQFFPQEQIAIKIYERFLLSEQYTPEKLMDIYKDSILLELKACEHMLYTMFRQADINFLEGNAMELILEDGVIAKSKEDELIGILDKVINERCGFRVTFSVSYKEAKAGKYKEDDETRIRKIVEHITSRVIAAETGAEIQEAVLPVEKTDVRNVDKLASKPQSSAESVNPQTAAFSDNRKAFRKSDNGGSGGLQRRPLKRSDNPSVIFGRDFEDETIEIKDIWGEMGEVAIRGQVRNLDKREIRNERTLVIFEFTDFTDTIKVKMFVHNEQIDELLNELKEGGFYRLKGVTVNDTFDRELTIGSVIGVAKIPNFTTVRMDNSARKRVELHCHTKMSDMDGVSDVKDIIKRAKKWGHRALAITDHGCVQAFPDANHALDHGDEFKVIYGVEAYLVDDLKNIVEHAKGQNLTDTYVVFDLETTGFSPINDRIIEIGAVKVADGKITERFSTFVNPEVPIPFKVEELTHIRDDMVLDAPKIEDILSDFMKFCEGAVMVAHNQRYGVRNYENGVEFWFELDRKSVD